MEKIKSPSLPYVYVTEHLPKGLAAKAEEIIA